jgi:polyhydroxyalkanoate synthesis regulator phasin/FtsZ-binding cell division protein ZapB
MADRSSSRIVDRPDTPPGRHVTVYDDYEHGPRDFGRLSAAIKRVSWGAIFAGAVVAVVIQILLNLAGLGVGLQTFNPASDGDSVQTLGTGQAIWTVIASLIALFTGGWVAGRMAGMPRRTDGGIHGLVMWGVTALFALYLISIGAGRIIGGALGLAGTGLEAAGAGIAAVAPEAARAVGLDELTVEEVRTEIEQLLRDTQNPALQPEALEAEAQAAQREAQRTGERAATDPGAARSEIEAAFNRLVGRAEGVASEADREDLVNILVARTDLSREEARQTVIRWERQAEQARETIGRTARDVQRGAVVAAEDATDVIGRFAMWAFIGMLLGAIAAVAGGWVGAPHDLPIGADRPREV